MPDEFRMAAFLRAQPEVEGVVEGAIAAGEGDEGVDVLGSWREVDCVVDVLEGV